MTLTLSGGTSSNKIAIAVTASGQSPVSAEGKNCIIYCNGSFIYGINIS